MNPPKVHPILSLCAFLLLGTYGPQAMAQNSMVQVVMTHLHCEHTTEKGHDEVFCLYGGVNGASQKTSGRLPGPQEWADADHRTAWDMNDGERNRTGSSSLRFTKSR